MNTILDKELALIYIFYLFVLPILLIYYHILPIDYRMVVLAGSALLMLAVVIHQNWSLSELGIQKHTPTKQMVVYLLFTIICIVGLAQFGEYLNHEPLPFWWTKPAFVLLFIPVSFFQEFAFRGFLMPVLEKALKKWWLIILVNAGLFSLLHIMYPNPALSLPLAFVGGLGFAAIYYKYPNLILISIAHAALNFTAILYGFFNFYPTFTGHF